MEDGRTPELSTRDRVLRLLCTAPRTAGQLAEELGISANAVRKALVRMEGEGLVQYGRVVRGVGKPSHEYELTLKGEQLVSPGYLPLLLALLEELRASGSAREVEKTLRAVAHRLPAGTSADGVRSTRARLQAAVSLLNDLGGTARVRGTADDLRIECTCCAIAAVVAREPLACKAVEALVAEVSGVSVREACDRTGRPHCRFHVRDGARV